MPFFVFDPITGQRVNDFGSDSTLSLADLGNFTIEYEPLSATAVSVEFLVNGSTVRTDDSGPFYISGAGETPSGVAGANFANGPVDIVAIERAADGSELLQAPVSVTIAGRLQTEPDAPKLGGGDGPFVEGGTEFNLQAEAESEAEAEAEAEAQDDAAGAAVGVAATAAAFGSNAVTQTAVSGSLDLSLRSNDERVEAQTDDRVGQSGEGVLAVGGDAPLDASGDNTPQREANLTIISSEAEAEVEIEAEVEVEIAAGSASVAVGTAGAAAAVGASAYTDEGGSARAFASETITSLDIASSTSSSVSDATGQIVYNVTPDPDQTISEANPAADTNATNEGPGPDVLIDDVDPDTLTKSDIETEVEVEAEAEAEAETGVGVAAAGVSGGSGVAVAGDFVSADTETAVLTSTSTSAVTEQQSSLFDGATVAAAAGSLTAPTLSFIPTAGSAITFSDGTDGVAQPDAPSAVIVVDTTNDGEDVPAGYAEGEAETEAEAEAEVEASVGNNSAAVAVIATGGAGSSGINATSLVSASVSGSTSTAENNGVTVGRNDVVETATNRADNDSEALEDRIFNRTDADGNFIVDPAEAEAEAEAEANVDLSATNPAVGSIADGSALGTSSSGSGVALSGSIVDRTGVVDQGIQGVSERDEIVDEPTSTREVVSEADPGTVISYEGIEVEREAEAEAESEAEVGFNSAAAGAAAVAVHAGNSPTGQTSEGTTATSTSTSVFGNGENFFEDRDAPGATALGEFGNVPAPDAAVTTFAYEIEVEAEAEAEVGINAGAAAAAAGAGGLEGIESVVETDSSSNAAAAAAASGANTEIIIRIPDDGEAGEVYAYARAWDPDGGGVAVAVAVAGLSQFGGVDNEAELEAEGLYEAVVEVMIDTSQLTDAEALFLFDLAAASEATGNNLDAEPEGPDTNFESETEVEAEAEAEAGYGVAAAAAAAATAGMFSDAQASTSTTTRTVDVAFGEALIGSQNADDLQGGADIDYIIGNAGDDTLSGGGSGDRLEGGLGNDFLDGGDGNDSLAGGAGDDTFVTGAGNDFVDGQVGNDTAEIGELVDGDMLYRDTSGLVYLVRDGGDEVDVFSNVENFETTTGTIAATDIEQFDGLTYLASNIDEFNTDILAGMTARRLVDYAANQFAIAGAMAGLGLAGFSAENYLAANVDLQTEFMNDPVGATLQYIQEGADDARDPGADGVQMLPPFNGVPIARADEFTTSGSFSVTAGNGVLINDFDPDADQLTAQLVGGAAIGTVTLNADGSFAYEAVDGYSGEDSFTYNVTDGENVSEEVSVTISVGLTGEGGGSIAPTGGSGDGEGMVAAADGNVGTDTNGTFSDANGTTIAGSTEGADTFVGTSEADIASGLGGDDTLSGGAGNDILGGGAGVDTLNGEAGNDQLNGRDGGVFAQDTLDGGTGSDVYRVNGDYANNESDIVTESADNLGVDEVISYGSFFEDTNGVAEILSISDDAARDEGYSYLNGGSSNKDINGSSGDDVIATGSGASRIDGGAGSDVFIFETSGDAGSTLFIDEDSGNDVVLGASAESDVIDLTALGLDVTAQEFFDAGVVNGLAGSVYFDLGAGNSLTFANTDESDLSANMFIV